jgi:acetate kinase
VIVLALNCGSTSVKSALYRHPPLEPLEGSRDTVQVQGGHAEALRELLERLGGRRPDLVAHRVVHGGPALRETTLIDERIVGELREVAAAPLHNRPALDGIEAARGLGVPMVAVFDSAFHRTLPDVARRYAIPRERGAPDRAAGPGLQRLGFHGLSHQNATERAAELCDVRSPSLITIHLGGGASMTAVREGRSIDTSMGVDTLEGLVMATRPGDLDPTILLALVRRGLTHEQLEDWLHDECGLRGLAGTGDMRELLARDDADARLAVDLYCYRIRKYLGAYLAVLGGRADAIVFTGGVGENSPEIRRRCLEGFEWAGIELDLARNAAANDPTRRISTDASRVRAFVVPADEERILAREAVRCFEESRR